MKTSTRLGLLRYLSKNVDHDGEQALLLVYNSLIRSVFSYAAPVLMIANKSYWGKMQIIPNKGLRLTMHVPPYTSSDYIHQQLNQNRILSYSEQQTKNFLNRAIQNGNKRITSIYKDTISLQSQIRLPLNICCSTRHQESRWLTI